MDKEVTIENDAQRQRLIAALKKSIEEDCAGGRAFLDSKVASGEAKGIPPKLMKVLRANIDAREAVYKKIIEGLPKAGLPMTAEDYFTRIIFSFATAGIKEDPVKKEYTTLVLGLIPPERIPPEILKAMGPPPEGHGVAGMITIPLQDLSHEELEAIDARSKTVSRLFNVAFTDFYVAASGKDKINVHAPDYRRFTDTVNELLGLNGPRQGH